jgi:hypothetical protein
VHLQEKVFLYFQPCCQIVGCVMIIIWIGMIL